MRTSTIHVMKRELVIMRIIEFKEILEVSLVAWHSIL